MTTMRTGRDQAEAMYAEDRACQALGITLDSAAVGEARVRMRVGDAMLNGHGMIHGGYVFLLADAAFAFACNTHGPVTVAQSAQISFLRPVEAGEELVAEAVERHRQGRTGIYDVTVRRADGAVVAEFRGQSFSLPSSEQTGR